MGYPDRAPLLPGVDRGPVGAADGGRAAGRGSGEHH